MFVVKRRRSLQLRNVRGIRGASLLEALIAILLSAIGLLALAGANVASVRYSKMSQYRGTATMLAADLAERMRANPTGLTGYAVTANFATQASLSAATDACETYSHTCSNAVTDMAAYDMASWRNLVRNQLPDGSVSIATATGAADVWLAWRDPTVASPSDNSTESRNYAKECPNNFSADKSVRCIYFRINL
jgi:type IV pilus assembly protein PilV